MGYLKHRLPSKRACDLYGQHMALSLSLIESGDNQSCKGRDMKRFSGPGEVEAVCEHMWMHSREEGLILGGGCQQGQMTNGSGELAGR